MAKRSTKPLPSSVGIKELKDRASAIVDRVERTRKPMLITKNNRQVARIVPVSGGDEAAFDSRQRLADLGLLASASTVGPDKWELLKISLDASIARRAIRSDRDED